MMAKDYCFFIGAMILFAPMKNEYLQIISTLEKQLAAQTQQNKQLFSQNKAFTKQIELLTKQLEILTTQNQQQQLLTEKLQQQLDVLLRTTFGKKSEKKKPTGKDDDENSDNKGKGKPPKTGDKSKKKPKRKPLPDNLSREQIYYELTEQERTCQYCQRVCHCIGQEVTEQLEFVPAHLIVKEHIRYKYGCPLGCSINIAALPPQPIDKGIAGPGLLADVLVSKYQDAIPLYRQARRFQRYNVTIAESTLCDWVAASANLLEPLIPVLKKELLKNIKIHSDDTTMPVLAKNKTITGRLWIYVADGSDGPACTVYDYSPDRTQQRPLEFLNGFTGYLQADAYNGYDIVYKSGKVVEVGCLAHVRRKFFDISSATKNKNIADEALAIIHEIYVFEAKFRLLSYAQRYYLRKRFTKSIYRKFHRWLIKKRKTTIPETPLAKAINYTLNHWRALQNVFANGRLEVDNNIAERGIRPIAVGRKNFLFAGSNEGGKRMAIIYSLIETCKQNAINAFEYLRDALARLPSHPVNKLHELLPFNWAALLKS